MDQIRLGISCIGSGVGQSVITSCNISNLPIYTVGFGTNNLAFGLYECDEYVISKSFYDKDYIEDIITKCKEYRIDIYIPGHDDDAHVISKNIQRFTDCGIKVIVSGEELLKLCRNKGAFRKRFPEVEHLFVKSYDRDTFIAAFESNDINLPAIAKPSAGFASKGIEILNNPSDFDRIKDYHIVQELAVPDKNDSQRKYYDDQIKKNNNPQVAELSIHLVIGKEGNILGRMISRNKLNNGVPIEILPYENDYIWTEIEKLVPILRELGVKGPINLQGRLTDNGLKLFEMNARFTGITGLRAQMGFNEVEACIRNWMDIVPQKSLELNYNKFGIRQTLNKAISLDWNNAVKKMSSVINGSRKQARQNLLITGSTGYLGINLIKHLASDQCSHFKIWVYTRDKIKAESIFKNKKFSYFDYEDLINGTLSMGNVDVLLHMGFARPHCTDEEIAKSLDFTKQLFVQAVKNHVPKIINISSQSVYSTRSGIPHTENNIPSPKSKYGMAKYSSEKLLEALCSLEPHIKYTSLRLSTLSGGHEGLVANDLFSKMINNVLKGKDIEVYDGSQSMIRMDVRDAVLGICEVLKSDTQYAPIYNLGNNQIYTLDDIAKKIIDVSANYVNHKTNIVKIDVKVEDQYGLDCSKFVEDFKWQPKYSLEDMIDSLYTYISKLNHR